MSIEIGQTYVVQEGDSITEIAYQAYGDARRYLEIVRENEGIPDFDPARLVPGMELSIPTPDYLPMPRTLGSRGTMGRVFKIQVRTQD